MRYPRSLMPIEPGRAPLRVFLTVDTEIWPRAAGWPHTPLPPGETCERERAAYFWGGEGRDRRGLPYQLETLARHGLKATYFVDPLTRSSRAVSGRRSSARSSAPSPGPGRRSGFTCTPN